jgi:VanZ family protein
VTVTVMSRVAVRPAVSDSAPLASSTRWVRRLAPVAWAGFVLVASVIEPSGGAPSPPVLGLPADKVLHGLTYATLAAALAVGLATVESERLPGNVLRERPLGRVALLAVVVATAYGLAIEGVQFPIPYRTFDLLDALANAVGAVVGAAGWVAGALVRRRLGR